jgi:hypothetical protein
MMFPREGQTYILPLYMFTRWFDDSLDISEYICMQSWWVIVHVKIFVLEKKQWITKLENLQIIFPLSRIFQAPSSFHWQEIRLFVDM